MRRIAFVVFALMVFVSVASAQKSIFTGKWEHWWDKKASKGFVVELKEKNGKISGTGSGFIPHLYEAEIKSVKISGNSFTAKVADDWGNTATVKINIIGRKMTWRVLNSKRKGSFTFPDKIDLRKTK